MLVQKSQVIQTKTVLITIEKQRTSYDFAKKAKELCHRLLQIEFSEATPGSFEQPTFEF